MIDYHVVVGALAVALTLVGYGSYFRSIFLGETKPHAFTWIVFTFIDGIIFFIQLGEGGGPGAWVLGVAALFSAVVSILSLRFGEIRQSARNFPGDYRTGCRIATQRRRGFSALRRR